MNSFIKKISFGVLVVALAFVFLPLNSKAQTPASTEQSVKDFYNNFPEVSVENINLPKTEYKAGDIVTGYFILRNAKTFDVPEVSYDVALAGDYGADGLVGVLYDKVRGGPVYLKSEESKRIDFSYKIPEALNGTKFGIHIGAVLKDGLTLSWGDSLIKVTGGKSALNIDKAFVITNNKTYGIQAGPTIKKNDSASLKITLSNPSNADLAITPTISLKKFIAGGEPVKFNGDAVMVGKNSSKEISISLNTNYDPAVYVGALSFVGVSGVSRAPVVEFRYIIGGDIINFQSVSADKTVLQKGESFNVSLLYSGAPIDIDNQFTAQKENVANLSVKVFNEMDALVAEYSNPNFNLNNVDTLSVPMTAISASKALRAEVSVSRDGNVVKKYNANLSSDYAEVQKTALDGQTSMMKKIVFAVVAIVALILIALSWKMLKNKRAIGMFLALIAVASVFSGAQKAQAFTVDSWSAVQSTIDWSGYAHGVVLSVSNPGLNEFFAPGEKFKPEGTFKFAACENTTHQKIVITAEYNGVTKIVTQIFDTSSLASHYSYDNGFFTFPTAFTVANNPGSIQTINFTMESYSDHKAGDGIHWDKWATLKGHQDFKVMQKPMINFSVVPTAVVSGGSAVLTWNVPNPVISLTAPTNVAFYNDPSRQISCTASGDWSGTKTAYSVFTIPSLSDFSVQQTETIPNITSRKTFTLSCSKMFHYINIPADSVTVSVSPGPTVTLTATPPAIVSGDSSLLTWTSTNAGASCTSLDFPTGGINKNTVGVSTGALSSTKTYKITCQGEGNTLSASSEATVTVIPALTASCSANPASINTGGSSTWTAIAGGGTGTYAYSWSGDDSLSGTGVSVSKTYSTTGTKNASVVVTSGTQTKTVSCSNSVVVATPAVVLSAPAPVAAVAQCGKYIKFTWPAVANATSYRVYDSTGNIFGATPLATILSTSPLEYSAGPFTSATARDYYVSAYASGSSESTKTKITVTPSADCPLPPPIPAISAVAGSCGGNINVSWTAVTGAVKYDIFRDGGTTKYLTQTSVTSFTDTVGVGVSHSYYVVAYNSAGTASQNSNTVTASGSGACAQPKGDIVIKMVGPDGTVATAPNSTLYPNPKQLGSNVSGPNSFFSGSSQDNPHIVANLTPGAYTSSVGQPCPFDIYNPPGGGNNLCTQQYKVDVGTCTYAIPAGGTASVSDEAPTGCTVSSFSNIGNPLQTAVNYPTTVTSGQVTKVVVKYSPVTTPPPTTLSAPAPVVSPAGCGKNIKFTWPSVSGATGYKVYDYTGTQLLSNIPSTGLTSYSYSAGPFTDFSGKGYYVSAYNATTESTKTNIIAFPSFDCPPPTVTVADPTPTETTGLACGGRVGFSWPAVSGATGYKVYDYTGTAEISDYTNPALSYVNAGGFTPATPYKYYIQAYSATASSNKVPITVTASAACQLDLNASLVASPTSGPAPLSVTLTAGATGSAVAKKSSNVAGAAKSLAVNTNQIVYTFFCGNGTSASPDTITTTSTSAVSSCSYSSTGTYTASAFISAAGVNANASQQISVTGGNGGDGTTPPGGGGGGGGTTTDPGNGICEPRSGTTTASMPIWQATVGSPVKWTVVNPDQTGSHAYSWTSWSSATGGSGIIIGTGPVLTKVYTTTGPKYVTLSVDGVQSSGYCSKSASGTQFNVVAAPIINQF